MEVEMLLAQSASHRVAAGIHVAQLLSQDATGFRLTPMRCGVKRRPAVKVHGRHVHAALREQPEEQNCSEANLQRVDASAK